MHNNIIPFSIKKSKKKIPVHMLFSGILSFFTKKHLRCCRNSTNKYTIRI